MSQTSRMVTALKKCLHAKGAAYRNLAEALSLSEASVKRVFSKESFGLMVGYRHSETWPS